MKSILTIKVFTAIRLLMLTPIMLFSCNKFEYSHYEVQIDNGDKNINAKNISRISDNGDDTLTIAVIGDSQRFYEGTKKTIEKINAIDNIDFVVHTGDLVDFGLQKEYTWMHQELSTLRPPYVAVVGNHDVIGNGGEIYQQMYGPYNFSFTLRGNKFIYVNTNGREFDFSADVPHLGWLEKELADTANYTNAIIVCHIHHTSEDFTAGLRDAYVDVLRKHKKVLLSINGHRHDFSYTPPGDDNISYLNSYSTSKEKFILVKIWDNEFSFQSI